MNNAKVDAMLHLLDLREVAAHDPSSGVPSFTPFPRLPAEIRLQIVSTLCFTDLADNQP